MRDDQGRNDPRRWTTGRRERPVQPLGNPRRGCQGLDHQRLERSDDLTQRRELGDDFQRRTERLRPIEDEERAQVVGQMFRPGPLAEDFREHPGMDGGVGVGGGVDLEGTREGFDRRDVLSSPGGAQPEVMKGRRVTGIGLDDRRENRFGRVEVTKVMPRERRGPKFPAVGVVGGSKSVSDSGDRRKVVGRVEERQGLGRGAVFGLDSQRPLPACPRREGTLKAQV